MAENTTQEVRTLKAHLALNVKSIAESMAFYRKMLGIEPSKVRIGYAKFDVHNPPLNLTLNQAPFGERGALSHLGIQVASTEDVAATRERWLAAGLTTRDEMRTDCCYAVQDKSWVSDPDGNQWEVFVVLEDNLPEKRATGTAGEGCCSNSPYTVVGARSKSNAGKRRQRDSPAAPHRVQDAAVESRRGVERDE